MLHGASNGFKQKKARNGRSFRPAPRPDGFLTARRMSGSGESSLQQAVHVDRSGTLNDGLSRIRSEPTAILLIKLD
jgi:hypothetical protein